MTTELSVVLTDVNARVVDAWRSAFAENPEVTIVRGSLLDQRVDAWVTPTNSHGAMNGGVDAVIKRHLGPGIQMRVQRAIRDAFDGALPIGSAVCVPSGAANPAYLISTPTMEHSAENVRETLNVALACAAAFQAVHMQNAAQRGSVRSVALVGMGAATGKVPPQVCANLMWAGYTLFREEAAFTSWDELRDTVTTQLGAATSRTRIRRS
ncbi:macro domain-containing protein [Catenuloplanes indicus]|uniref:O-acetyl-ADP-ribose deacetylase (Regulator of RNase III) n=1 Tax=Catenuloplanes indicus TaxID=137267 RepID=A0AAE4AXT4_9ACTN|nr:macro domain-containing protein [Catenuloplanes indicus]MDQ0366557.1 O-acetyl-ADP-ribose deacetylase (regulator of RNase III) [Catenuloplanes indicus]